MELLKKYLGIVLIFIGALLLIIPGLAVGAISSNPLLITSLVLLIAGLLAHIFLNR